MIETMCMTVETMHDVQTMHALSLRSYISKG